MAKVFEDVNSGQDKSVKHTKISLSDGASPGDVKRFEQLKKLHKKYKGRELKDNNRNA